jgi:AraC-like DNA-binding protein
MLDSLVLQPTPARYFQLILRRFGATPEMREALLEGVDISPERAEGPELEVNLLQQVRQAENMNRMFGEGWLLQAPELWRPSAHAALGVAVISAPTVHRALEVLATHLNAIMPGQELRLAAEGQVTALRFASVVAFAEWWERLFAELVLLSVASSLGWLLGDSAKELAFEYQWPEPAYGARLAETLGGEVRWAAGANAIRVPARRLDLRSPFSDPPLFEHALKRLTEVIAAQRAPDSLKGQVERLLAHSESGRLAAQAVADSLGMSHRTLERHLADEGAHFRDLVDAELSARARRMLDANVLTRTEIAEQLGFADVTGFSRAYRRWLRTAI